MVFSFIYRVSAGRLLTKICFRIFFNLRYQVAHMTRLTRLRHLKKYVFKSLTKHSLSKSTLWFFFSKYVFAYSCITAMGVYLNICFFYILYKRTRGRKNMVLLYADKMVVVVVYCMF